MQRIYSVITTSVLKTLSNISIRIIIICGVFSIACSDQKESNLATVEKIDQLSNDALSLWYRAPLEARQLADTLETLFPLINDEQRQGSAAYHIGLKYLFKSNLNASLEYLNTAVQTVDSAYYFPAMFVFLRVLEMKGEYLRIEEVLYRETKKEWLTKIQQLELEFWFLVKSGRLSAAEQLLPQLSISQQELPEKFYPETYLILLEFLRLSREKEQAKDLLLLIKSRYKGRENSLNYGRLLLEESKINLVQNNYAVIANRLDSAKANFQKIDFSIGSAYVNWEYGNFYYYLNDYAASVEHYLLALDALKESGNLLDFVTIQLDLGWVYSLQGLHTKAKDLYENIEPWIKSIQNPRLEAYFYNNCGFNEEAEKNYEASALYYSKSFHIYDSIQNIGGILASKYNWALSLKNQGLVDSAIWVYSKLKEISNVEFSELERAQSNTLLGNLYLLKGDLLNAKYHLESATEILEDKGTIDEFLENLRGLNDLYQKIGNKDKLIETLQKLNRVRETYFTQSGQTLLVEMETIYSLKTKDNQIKVLDLERISREQELELKEKTIANQELFLILIIIALSFIGILFLIFFRVFRLVKRSNIRYRKLNLEIKEQREEILVQAEELQEANERIREVNEHLEDLVQERTKELQKAHGELDNFYYRASHDFKGPVSTLLGLFQLAKMSVKEQEALQLFEKVHTTAEKMGVFIDKLNLISSLSARHLKMKQVIWKDLAQKLEKRFHFSLKNKNIQLSFSLPDTNNLLTDQGYLFRMLELLVENAIQFSNPGTLIKVEVTEKDKSSMQIKVIDQGIGIPDELKDKVFEMYVRGSVNSDGNGLGLFIVKKIVDALDGEIDFTSEKGKGTTFVVNL